MPKILRVKDTLDKFGTKKKMLPDLSNRSVFIAKSGQGKSNLIVNLLLRKEPEFYNDDFDGENIFLISPSAKCDDKLRVLIDAKDIPSSNIFNEYSNDTLLTVYDLIKDEYMERINDKQKPPNYLIVIDDCLTSLKDGGRNNGLERVFVNGRHYNCSCWVTSQYYTKLPAVVRANANALYLFDTSHKELQKIAEEVSSVSTKEFISKFRENMPDKHSFILVDFTKNKQNIYKNQNFDVIKF